MTEKKNGKSEEEEAYKQSAPASEPVQGQGDTPSVKSDATIADIKAETSSVSQEASSHSQQVAQHKADRPLNRYERWMIVINSALVLTGIAAAIIFAIQLRILSNQLDEVRRGSADTKTLALSAVTQAETAKTAAEVSKKALENSSRAFEQQTRAWLSVNKIEPTPINETQRGLVYVNVRFTNSGQSPAIDVIAHQDWALGPEAYNLAKRLAEPHGPHSSKSPQAPQQESFTTAVVPVSEENLTAVKSGKKTICVFGSIFYSDIFGKRHETEFCVYYLSGGAWAICAKHNGMYDEK